MSTENKELKIIELKAELFDLRNEGEKLQNEYNQKQQILNKMIAEKNADS